MRDFNEVRNKNERFGSVFNINGANAFNLFISKAGLEEIPLGGCSFTWCNKAAKKMSKLDRFIVFESLMSSCPNILAITLNRETLMKKLKYLKQKIREWHKINKKSDHTSRLSLKKELADLDKVIDNGECNEQVVNKRMDVIKSIQDLEKVHSLEVAQKAKIKWAIEGGENSKYYHGILNKKRNQLTIRGVLADGIWIDEPSLVKREFLAHFKTRFNKPNESRIRLNMHFPNILSSDQRVELEIEVSKKEIKKAVWDCGIDKSPGPDGFTFGFYRRYWKVIESDVVDVMVKDYRPISLIGSLYKIIAKILANRLVNVLGDIVNEVQLAFIADRQILDGPFILNELFQWCKSKKKQSLIFKVDFEKAYDSVRWEFLDDILTKFGFGDMWCGWIRSCLTSSRGSILVSGSPTEEFQFHKGLKQGDPPSPFLFILVMENLHISFQRVVDAGLIKGIVLGLTLQLSHMFYVDDAVFVGQWSDANIDTLVHVLDCFHRASGMHINMNKSKLIGIFVDEVKVTIAASKIGCLVLKPHFSYLVPMRVLQRLESIRSHFFNGNDIHGKNLSCVKWKKVLASKEKGGLGVSSLYALNRGLLLKWVWRFITKSSSLWARVIKEIHGDDGKTGKNAKSNYPSIWLDIVHEMEVLKKQDVKVASKLSLAILDFSFRRDPRGGAEEEQFIDLSNQIEGVILTNSMDRWIWTLEGSREFSVASVRKLIDDKMLSESDMKTRWIKVVPLKINVHAWKVSLDCLPTRLNISRRGMDIDSILCPMCDKAVESTSHLFFTCHVAREVFRKITRWWDVSYMDLHSYEEWVTWILNLRLSIKYKKLIE
ncbi:RNA-directed DNA polymerase, eukaryota, partial [Tanacetum coccineum]